MANRCSSSAQSAASGEGQMRATLDLAKEMGSGISRQQEMRKARGAMLFQEYKKKMGMVQPRAARAQAQAAPPRAAENCGVNSAALRQLPACPPQHNHCPTDCAMTNRGKIVFTIIFLALVGFGITRWWPKISAEERSAVHRARPPRRIAAGDKSDSSEEKQSSPRRNTRSRSSIPRALQPKDNIVDIELSEYAGYSGLIAPTAASIRTTTRSSPKDGFKVRLKLSEEESWTALNSGKMAARATTVDVLAVYGKQFKVVVPAQIGFSRGADGIVVRKDVRRVNDLKGKVLAASQFTEADFFIRYLAQEAGLGVADAAPTSRTSPSRGQDQPRLCRGRIRRVRSFPRGTRSAALRSSTGCVTWAPKTRPSQSRQSKGRATLLTTNRNLLVIADI